MRGGGWRNCDRTGVGSTNKDEVRQELPALDCEELDVHPCMRVMPLTLRPTGRDEGSGIRGSVSGRVPLSVGADVGVNGPNFARIPSECESTH